jgi:signal transduction histidine kinase
MDLPFTSVPDRPPVRVLFVAAASEDIRFLDAAQHRLQRCYQIHRASGSDELDHHLAGEPFHMVIVADRAFDQETAHTVQQIRQHDPDITVLALSEVCTTGPWPQSVPDGADDLVSIQDTFRLDLALARAVRTSIERRHGRHAANALEESEKQLRALTRHLETIKEEERHRIAREIHDDIGATLTALRFELVALARQTDLTTTVSGRVETMGQLLERAVEASHRIQHNLRPPVLDAGLVAALQWLVRDFQARTNIPTRFESNREDIPLEPACAAALYRVAQESLTNIRKYAQAATVSVQAFVTAEDVTLEISDDGAGFDAGLLHATPGFGLRSMIERARGLDGWAEVSSAPGRGTTIMFCVPLTFSTSAV